MKFKIILKICLLFVFFILLCIIFSSILVELGSRGRTYSSAHEIPANKVGLLLGTAKTAYGLPNLFYVYRINAAVELFEAGKIDFILVSGDNSREDYDESSDMKNDLIEKGIPENQIYLDYAGFRTLDSVVRSKEIFGQESITVISQEFHNERAIFIARKHGIDAVGYNAQDVEGVFGLKVQLREQLARVKVVLDWITHKQPKFLGESIEIK